MQKGFRVCEAHSKHLDWASLRALGMGPTVWVNVNGPNATTAVTLCFYDGAIMHDLCDGAIMIYDGAIMICDGILCCLFYFILFGFRVNPSCAIFIDLGGIIIQPNLIFSFLFLSCEITIWMTNGLNFFHLNACSVIEYIPYIHM